MGTNTRDRILDVAEDLIQRRGANGMSYKDISAAVGIRNASIHYHFPAKEDLVRSLVERYSRRFLTAVDEILESPVAPPEKLSGVIGLFEDTLRDPEKVCLCGVLGAEIETLDEEASRGVRRFYREGARRVTRILEAGAADGTLRFAGTAEALGSMIFSVLEGGMLVTRAAGGLDEFQRIREQLFAMVRA